MFNLALIAEKRTNDTRAKDQSADVRGEKLDRAGATASLLCAIHCAIMPLLITVLPLLGLGFLSSEPVEWALLFCSATLGVLSLCLGYREHRRRKVFAVLGGALCLLVVGRLLEEHDFSSWGTVLVVLGGLSMVGAHVFNRALCRSCGACGEDDGCERSL